jgi:small conductance mechanosensitive channel
MTESVTDKVVEHISDNSLTNGVLHAGNWISKNQDLLVQYAVNIVSAVLILFIGNIIVKMIAGTIAKVLRKKDMDNAVVEFIHGLVRYVLFVIVLIAALGRIGIQTASVVAVIGAAGLAIGLALQGSLSNFAAGVLIVGFRPFKSGDYVEVAGVAGAVESIQIFSTELRTGVVALADSSVNFVVRPWVNTPDYWAVYFDLNQAIKEELDKEGIEIPFPQMDVHVNKVAA